MAQRRMFSVKIIDSAKFLKMPVSTQALYFHLCMRADDDGIVEGFNVLRMTGATEDDLRILVAKQFINILNDDLVSYVTDWNEHNKIRADRKIDSIYKDLLVRVMPDVKLLEARKRADLKENKNMDVQWTDNGQTMGSIGKDRLGKVSIDKVNNKAKKETVEKTKYADYVSMTTKEYEKLIDQYGEPMTKRMIEILDNYKGSSGKKYKSDYRTILNWVVERVKKEELNSNTNNYIYD